MEQLKVHVRATWMKEQEVYNTRLWEGDGKERKDKYCRSACCMHISVYTVVVIIICTQHSTVRVV